MYYKTLAVMLFGIALSAAEMPKTVETAVRPIATIQSSRGLVVNGVPTPPGVNSVIVAPGDVIATMDAPAAMRFMEGGTVTLAPAKTYQVPARPGGALVVSRAAPLRPTLFALPPISVHKP